MHFDGLIVGAVAFLIIGAFHPLVIKAEYYFGVGFWRIFLLAGICAIGASLFVAEKILSAALGVLGFSCLWSIREMFEQRRRVEEGRFPQNPKRAKPSSDAAQFRG